MLKLFSFFSKSFKGNFNNVPLLKLKVDKPASLCIPITLLFSRFNIGEPDEPFSVEHVCLISFFSIFLNNPYDTQAFFPLGY